MSRISELYLVITFQTTTQALYMEKKAKEHQMPGRMIPLPKAIDAGCGLVWATKERDKKIWNNFLKCELIPYDQMVEVNI